MTERARVVCLPPQVANQIAAGEVVTRPSSVVKELVENSIDAGATRIAVDIDGGGVTRIRVVDDGIGMDREDATLALERHATSKIREAEDLQTIRSFGFRGEALPSIASVSRFRLRTRPHDADEGTEVVVEGGETAVVKPCGTAPGTTIEIEDLFFNVPARRKFLRATSTESAHVGDALKSMALAHPHIQFEISRDGRRRHRWLSADKRRDRVTDILEGYTLYEAHGSRGPVSVEAYLSAPDRARTGAGGLYLFVLDRPVQDRALARAVATAYGPALDPGRYPVGAVFLDVDPELVDVNVHPQKTEVRFAHARAVADALHGVISDALGERFSGPMSKPPAWAQSTPTPTPTPWSWQPTDSSPASRPPTMDPSVPPSGSAPAGAMVWPARGPAAPARPAAPSPPASTSDGSRLLATVRGHLLLEDETGVRFVSRTRARRAWLMMRAEAELKAGGLVAQQLLFPMVRELDQAEVDRLAVAEREAQWLGVALRRRDAVTIAVSAVPRLFAAMPHEPLLDALLRALLEGGDVAPTLDALCDDAAQHWVGDDDGRMVTALAEADRLSGVVTTTVAWQTLDDG